MTEAARLPELLVPAVTGHRRANLLFSAVIRRDNQGADMTKSANLFTCTLVALDVDTGKMKRYIQTSPHDTHDRNPNQTPILIDGDYQGQPALR